MNLQPSFCGAQNAATLSENTAEHFVSVVYPVNYSKLLLFKKTLTKKS